MSKPFSRIAYIPSKHSKWFKLKRRIRTARITMKVRLIFKMDINDFVMTKPGKEYKRRKPNGYDK